VSVSKSFRIESITKYKLTPINTRQEVTQIVMAAKCIALTHRIAIQIHPVQRAVPFAVLAPGGQSGNFWIHPRIAVCVCVCARAQIETGSIRNSFLCRETDLVGSSLASLSARYTSHRRTGSIEEM
jgi:hypothetical protein